MYIVFIVCVSVEPNMMKFCKIKRAPDEDVLIYGLSNL